MRQSRVREGILTLYLNNMYISPEQLKARLSGQSNLELKRREGLGKRPELPREMKVLAGALAQVDSQQNVAKAFGTSQANISNIVNNQELSSDIDAAARPIKKEISTKALDILMTSLEVVDRKVDKETAKEASSIARNMAAIVSEFSPDGRKGEGFAPKILINIHGSKQKEKSDYDAIEVEAMR